MVNTGGLVKQHSKLSKPASRQDSSVSDFSFSVIKAMDWIGRIRRRISHWDFQPFAPWEEVFSILCNLTFLSIEPWIDQDNLIVRSFPNSKIGDYKSNQSSITPHLASRAAMAANPAMCSTPVRTSGHLQSALLRLFTAMTCDSSLRVVHIRRDELDDERQLYKTICNRWRTSRVRNKTRTVLQGDIAYTSSSNCRQS